MQVEKDVASSPEVTQVMQVHRHTCLYQPVVAQSWPQGALTAILLQIYVYSIRIV